MGTLARSALSIGAAAALLAGCSGSQPPIGALRTMPQSQTSAIATHAEHGGSWMEPDTVSQDLLYVSDNDAVNVYNYPQGTLVGILKGGFYLATGECVDGGGNVFIVNTGNGEVFKYAHGDKKRIATLHSPSRDPVGCAVDPVSGNLAVGSEGFGSAATVAVFNHARGKPKVYADPSFYEFYFCAYDSKGNLFADGLTAAGSGHFGLAELARGASTLRNIAVGQYVRFPGGIQWKGNYLVVGDQFTSLYEFSIKDDKAVHVGTINLAGAMYVKQTWVEGQIIFAPNVYIPKGKPAKSDILVYNYPSGGKPIAKITKAVRDAQGATVSLAPH